MPALDAVRDRLPALERVVVVGGDADEYEPFLAARRAAHRQPNSTKTTAC